MADKLDLDNLLQPYRQALSAWEEPAATDWLERGMADPPAVVDRREDSLPKGAGLSGLSDPRILERLAKARMPFGKYKDRLLINLPEAYVLWFEAKGYPEGSLGEQLALLRVVKENGLEALLRPLSGSDA